jgi:hypothetical protein
LVKIFVEDAMPKKKPVKKTAPKSVKKEKAVKKKKIDFDDETEEEIDEDIEAADAHEVDEVGVEPAFGADEN